MAATTPIPAAATVSPTATIATPATPVPVASTPPVEPKPSRPELARDAYVQRDFLRAARMYEALFADTGAVKFLYNAGMAREAAGHDAEALMHWHEYLRLTDDIAADERIQLLEQMAAARRRTAPIRLRLASPGRETIELRYAADAEREPLRISVQGRRNLDLDPGAWTASVVGSSAPPQEFIAKIAPDLGPQDVVVRPKDPSQTAARLVTVRFGPPAAISAGISVSFAGRHFVPERTLRSAESTWKLTPEQWTLRARAPGYLPTELALGPALPPSVDVELRRDWSRVLSVGLGVGFAAAGVALLAAGTTLTLRGARKYRGLGDELAANDPLSRADADAVTGAIGQQTIGYGLLGAGVGAGVAAITGAIGGRRALIAEASVGVALALTGAIGLPLTVASYADVAPADATLADADVRRRRDHAFGATLGAGLALTSAALVALIARQVLTNRAGRARRATVQPTLNVAPHAGSLGIRGRF